MFWKIKDIITPQRLYDALDFSRYRTKEELYQEMELSCDYRRNPNFYAMMQLLSENNLAEYRKRNSNEKDNGKLEYRKISRDGTKEEEEQDMFGLEGLVPA